MSQQNFYELGNNVIIFMSQSILLLIYFLTIKAYKKQFLGYRPHISKQKTTFGSGHIVC